MNKMSAKLQIIVRAKILKILENETYKIDNLEDAKLHNIALIAGREEIDLVNLVLQAQKLQNI